MSKFKENVLTQIKENSGISGGSLSEASESGDISSTLDLVGKIIDEKYNYSLGYQICEVQPLKSTFGKTFAVRRKQSTGDFEVIAKDIHPKTNVVKTGYTPEVWQDMQKMLGKNALESSAKIMGGLSAREENQTIIGYISNNAESTTALTLSDDENFETIVQEIGLKVSQSVLEMNEDPYHTLDSFCILPQKYAAAILGSYSFMTEDFSGKTENERSLFVGRIGRTDFYVNPFKNDTQGFNNDYNDDYAIQGNTSIPDFAYVGLKSKDPGENSLIFAPYIYEIQNVIDPDTAENNLFLYNRYGLVFNPLHQAVQGKSMLQKFIIEGTP